MATNKIKINDVEFYEDPIAIENKIWQMLDEAVNSRASECRTPVFICGHNNQFDGRTVVLRAANQQGGFLQFHADYRSSKIAIIQENEQGVFVFYDRRQKIQLRIKTKCQINYKNKISHESWLKTQHISRKAYLTVSSPGSVLDKPGTGLTEKHENFLYSAEESELGFENFCVFRCNVQTIEWLFLSAKGHRRAKIDYEDTQNKFTWLTP